MKNLLVIFTVLLGLEVAMGRSLAPPQEIEGVVKVKHVIGFTCLAIGCPPAPNYYALYIQTDEGFEIFTGIRGGQGQRKPLSWILGGVEVIEGDRVLVQAYLNRERDSLSKIFRVEFIGEACLPVMDPNNPLACAL